MSHLRLFQPLPSGGAETFSIFDEFSSEGNDGPAIIPFNRIQNLPVHRAMDSLTRARLLHENRQCPHCQHPVVHPLEVCGQTFGNRQLMPVPGQGTLVGFRCDSCQAEWPV